MLINYSILSIAAWSSIVAYSLYKTSIKGIEDIEKNELHYHTVGNIIPLALSIASYLAGILGHTVHHGFCWIKDFTHISKGRFIQENETKILL